MEPPSSHHDHDHDHGQTSPKTPPSSFSSSCSSVTHHNHSSSTTCHNCGGPTSFPPPPQPSPISPPLAYIPIRAPSHYLPPNHNPQQTIMLTPVPQSLPVIPISLPHAFRVPEKRIHSPDDIIHFHSSSAFKHFLGFIVSLSESVRCHKISDPCHQSSLTNTLVSTLQTMITWIDEIPPVPQSSRYGNYAYRDWQDRLNGNVESILMNILLADELKHAVIELAPYLLDSFGNASRIDYGTGHEANFVAFLYCLARIGLVKAEDYQAMVSRVFVKYLELMRKLQLVYFLEPAGSHGVWGLDDYHFLPFIFGSSQLIDHKYMKPKSIHNDDILDNFSNEYMYLSCIAFVKKVKKGPFAEHSPMLDDISGVPNWNKVNSGMLKMYKVEVLEKVPIMQHFLFGSLIPWEEKAK